ncbi:ABC transporter ATP-binding protein [Amorphus orientalis]|uniref:Spermidine/putrescine transport system ATP-binding protein n=1 Tax=Amorphus orientalis TaxID=649198 RepID=A0AAE4AW75_9HYPH|nr:ABC transporter ATP-binding protein [Amorphus orientalis]MDQ0317474.1 putative spermidine/putrescine transport system ATP-binding protein [Amorphus orientalis]
MSGKQLTLEACGKTYPDGTRALTPVDLTVAAGEIVVLLGPSGCGKTTLLRMVAGLDRPDPGGRVMLDGRDVTTLPIEKRGVGMVFQSYALFPHMSVAGNIGYGLRVQGWPKAKRKARVDEMLATARLEEFAGRRVDQLSGGQRQRVALARALAPGSGMILLDEPLTALDAGLREGLRAEIAAMIHAQGATALYVTHDQAEALTLGDRLVVMDKGRIAQVGTPREVYYAPQSDYVAGFFGHVNRLSGTVENGVFTTAAGTLALPGRPNGETTLAFRPEAAVVGAANGLTFTVKAALFEGPRQRVDLAGPEGEHLVAFAPGIRPYAPGDQVTVSVDPDGLLATGASAI